MRRGSRFVLLNDQLQLASPAKDGELAVRGDLGFGHVEANVAGSDEGLAIDLDDEIARLEAMRQAPFGRQKQGVVDP